MPTYYDDDDDDRPRRRRRRDDDDEDDYDDLPRRRREYGDRSSKNDTNGLAIAALVLGALSIFTTCLTGVPAMMCGVLALGKSSGRGMAIGGIVLGLLGTIVGFGIGYYVYTLKQDLGVRRTDQNNMKQVALAFHNVHSATGGMPGPYHVDQRGEVNTGLSWRVALLPYVEQDGLYRGFNTREAWDGPANRRLSDTPLAIYTSPYDAQKASTNTPYRVFYGGGALFNEDGKPARLTEILDGTSNTILFVHAWDQVPWAAPREFKYDPKGLLPKFGHPQLKGGFNVAMADGSVRFVKDTVPERTLRVMITKADGEAVPFDW